MSTSIGAKLKRPNGSGSTYISAQKPGVVQAVAIDVHGVKRNKSFRFEVGKKASQARAEHAANEWLSDVRRAKELGQATFAASPKMLVSEFLDNWLNSRKPPKKPLTVITLVQLKIGLILISVISRLKM